MKVLLFGANGDLGSEIKRQLSVSGHSVTTVGHSVDSNSDYSLESNSFTIFIKNEKFDGVIFAGGINLNDSIKTFSDDQFNNVMNANLNFIMKSVRTLLNAGALQNPSSILVLSSIWHSISRKNKLSYTVSKSAIDGLIRSLALDLGEEGIRVNGLAPGVVNNKMTKLNLSDSQIEQIQESTPLKSLVTERNVADSAIWLISPSSYGITGQTIDIDGGWSIAKYV